MSLRHRIGRIERDAPEPDEPLEVVVRRSVVRSTPDGPLTLCERTDTVVDGKRTVGPWLHPYTGEPVRLSAL